MENKNAIYNDDVEQIVNEPERQKTINDFYKKRWSRMRRRMLKNSLMFAVLAIAFAMLGAAGWLVPTISFVFSSVCVVPCVFCFGRWFENGKCTGWK